eukprot:TRINITY_DN19836_c1_g2_i4.p2 TRINITY_DN19836_c1_g2~~TRINITY_DN19836_c1_g2_i4.p2  ORF type:complete len:243 (+),score=19.12 TRINITY_DN19836_c1_g2_i4:173-901(+)
MWAQQTLQAYSSTLLVEARLRPLLRDIVSFSMHCDKEVEDADTKHKHSDNQEHLRDQISTLIQAAKLQHHVCPIAISQQQEPEGVHNDRGQLRTVASQLKREKCVQETDKQDHRHQEDASHRHKRIQDRQDFLPRKWKRTERVQQLDPPAEYNKSQLHRMCLQPQVVVGSSLPNEDQENQYRYKVSHVRQAEDIHQRVFENKHAAVEFRQLQHEFSERRNSQEAPHRSRWQFSFRRRDDTTS